MNFRLSFLFLLSCAVALATDRRIKDIVTTATEPAADDYVAMDGATNGTRKILGLNLRPVTLSGSNTFLSGASVTFAAGSTLTISGVLSGTPTGGTLNLSSVTVTLGSVSATSFDLSGATITGTIGVTNGGTGRATGTTAYALLATGTTPTGAQQSLPAGATTEILVGGGASALPIWTTATGSGAPVRAVSPALTTPNLGTPSAITLTNGTGLPIATGVAGLGTNVASALAVNAGSSGAFLRRADLEHEKTLTFDNIADGDDYVAFFTRQAITVVEIRGVHFGSGLSSPSVVATVKHGTDVTSMTTVEAVTVTSSTTGTSVTSGIDDATIPANSWVRIALSGKSGTTNDLAISITYTHD